MNGSIIIPTQKPHLVAFATLSLFLACGNNSNGGVSYKSADAPIDERVKDLLSRMTLEEKVAQMCCITDLKKSVDQKGHIRDAAFYTNAMQNGMGEITDWGLPNRTPECKINFNNEFQKILTSQTRLAIPAIVHSEGTRCAMATGATLFPSAISLASTWDPELVRKVYDAIGTESRAVGVHQVLAPVVDIAREPRWGRVEETYGEDPYLVTQMGMQAVLGLQGDAGGRVGPRHVIATLKHFAAYGQPERGLNEAADNCSMRILRDVFFPPFKQIIQKGNVQGVMASYNEIDGVPSSVNKWLLRDVLRTEWGFKGMIVTDYGCFTANMTKHRISNDPAEIARLACVAGVNIEYPQPDFYPKLVELVRKGIIEEPKIDELVRPILELKFKLGLFENPYLDTNDLKSVFKTEANNELALQAARESLILLKNQAGFAPLDQKKIKTIAVIGPHANSKLYGNPDVVIDPGNFVTVYDGIRQLVGNNIEVLYAEGCKITVSRNGQPALQNEAEAIGQIAQAMEVARKADVVVLALGGSHETSRFNVDNSDLKLPGYQEKLVDEISKTGKPIVTMIFGGKTFALPDVYEKSATVLYCWYPGQAEGTAVAEVLFGKYNPGGKLPMTIARSVGHIPAFYNHKPQEEGHYVLESKAPLYCFGCGLSYTTFKYGNPSLEKDTIRKNEAGKVSVDVTNSGKTDGDEVVQMYVRQQYSSVTRPVKELKGFKRIHLRPGETRSVEFDITPEKLSFYNINMDYTVEPGAFDIMVGASSEDNKTALLTVTD